MEVLQRIPFLRLLLPLLVGIVVQNYIDIYRWSIVLSFVGVGCMLFSFFIRNNPQYSFRYLFGIGASMCFVSIGFVSTFFRQEEARHVFPDISQVHNGTIIDLPQEKPKTVALKLILDDTGKQIVCYLPKNKPALALKAGESISFFGKIEKFKKSAAMGGFDYPSYMHNKGYAGVVFVKETNWEISKVSVQNITALSSTCRQGILEYYQSLELSELESGILAALSLGYTDLLSDDLVQSFRATGTAHLLAVSGMHMVIFYSILWSVSGLFFRQKRFYTIRYVAILFLLWLYVFVIGFPSSAVRACVMLTFLSVAQAKGLQSYSFNLMFACALCMLVWNPLWLFDVGFQLSFVAVFSMLVFLPMLSPFIHVKSRLLRYFVDILLISAVVQVGTLPLCLYYFGMFPSYFLISNLFIVPLFTAAVYVALLIVGVAVPALVFPSIAEALYYIPVNIFKLLVRLLSDACFFFEALPFSLFNDLYISFPFIFLLWVMSFSFLFFLKYNHPRLLIIALSAFLIFLGVNLYNRVQARNSLLVTDNRRDSGIVYYVGFREIRETGLSGNKMINLKGKSYLLLTEDNCKDLQVPSKRKDLDYLHISHSNNISLYSISKISNIKKVILDSTLPDSHSKRLVQECEKLRIPYYHVSDNGALRIFF